MSACRRSLAIFLEHDLFRKPVTTLGSSPRAGISGSCSKNSFLRKIHRRLEAVAAGVARPQISDATLTQPLGPFRHDQCTIALGAARKLTGTLGRCRVHGLDRHCCLLANFFSFLHPPRRKLPWVYGRDATLGKNLRDGLSQLFAQDQIPQDQPVARTRVRKRDITVTPIPYARKFHDGRYHVEHAAANGCTYGR